MGSLHSSPASTPSPNKRFKTSSSSSFAVLSCPECDLEFPNADDLDNHISSAHNQIEVRPEFEDEIEEEKVSPKTKSFRCKKCPERFETEGKTKFVRFCVGDERHKISENASVNATSFFNDSMTFHDSPNE